MSDSPPDPDDSGDTPGRAVPPEDCRECSDDPDAPGLCIDCFLA